MVMRRAFLDFKWARDMTIGACLGVASIFLQVRWILIPLQDWSAHKWQWIGSVVIPVLIVLAVHIGWRLATAPWRVHQDQEAAQLTNIDLLRKENEVAQQELDKLRTVAPVIEITIGPLIQKGALGEGVKGLFVSADLTLREPAQVKIDGFKLLVCPPVGVPQEVAWIDDMPNWVRVIRTINDYKCVSYPAAIKNLSQRGETIVCCFHFLLNMAESELLNSDLILKVVTPHGTCSKSFNGANAFPDEMKGIMMEWDSNFVRSLWPGFKPPS